MIFFKKLFMLYNGLNKGLMNLICCLLMIMMSLVTLNVLGRKFLNRPIEGSIEINEYLLYVIPFLGAAYILQENSHVKIDLVLRLFKPKTQAVITGILMLIMGVVFIVYGWYAYINFYTDFISGFYLSSVLKMPRWIYGIVMLIGFALLAIQSFINAYKFIICKKM